MAATYIVNSTVAGTLVALVGGTEKTVIQMTAAANHRVRIIGFNISFNGTSTTAEPVKVYAYQTDGAGTLTAANPVASDSSVVITIQTTGGINATLEPGSKVSRGIFLVHPQQAYTHHFPSYAQPVIGAGTTTDGFAIAANAPVGVSCSAAIWAEE